MAEARRANAKPVSGTSSDATSALPPDHDERCQIVEQLDTTMLVEAAAGTGKTTSLIGRMVALLREGKCQIDTLAAVTFTRKAAAELRARFGVELERAAREASGAAQQRLAAAVDHMERCFIGTIHSYCARLLRERPIEAGIDVAFEELDPEVDTRLLDQAWSDCMDELYATDNAMLVQLHELGLEIEDLRQAFKAYANYPDVAEWPAADVELGDLGPVVGEVREYVQHMDSLVPTFPDERGGDKLMDKYEFIVRQARQLDLQRPADLMNLLESFDRGDRATQKEWPEGNRQGKQEQDRWKDFRDSHVGPWLRRWREKRYATVLKVLEQARLRYDRLRHSSGGLNYQDLLMRAAELLRDKPAIREYFRRRFTHVCVDEFQDTDPVQAEVMMYLTSADTTESDWRKCQPVPGSLFVVGDPKQSIYRFRRADIVTYNQVRQIIEESGGSVVALTANFRTQGDLVKWGNDIFDQVFPPTADAFSPASRAMLVGRQGDSDGELAAIRRLTVPETSSSNGDVVSYEADRIANYIRHALDSGLTVPRTPKELARGVSREASPGDFLIVARNKWNLAVFALKLQELNVPHEVTGGSALSQVPELSLLEKCLAALVEPDNPVALVAVLRGDLFGFSDEVLFAYRQAHGRFSYRAKIPEKLPKPVAELFENAYQQLLRYASWLNRLPPISAIERIAANLGLTPQAAATAGGDIQAGTMAKAFEMLRSAQAELHSAADLVAFLRDLIDQNVEFDGLPARPHEESAVRIMNLHKVKGLEAPVVFLADATGKKSHKVKLHIDRSGTRAKGYLSIYGRKRGKQAPPLLAQPVGWEELAAEESRFGSAEENRLRYVAATRVGTKLVITQREKGNTKNHWEFFERYISECEELVDPGPQSAPLHEPVVVSDEEVITAAADIAARWQETQQPSYATAAAKEISITPSGIHHVHTSGEHGTEWGTVIHFLLETAMDRPETNLDELAYGALVEQNLDPTLAPAAVAAVNSVKQSDIWRRALDSEKRLIEVPFQRCLPAAEGKEGMPTLLRGVIDLVFREDDAWVIVDYKTDAGAAGDLDQLITHYRPQLCTYGDAWKAIVGEEVRERGLLFIAVNQYVTV